MSEQWILTGCQFLSFQLEKNNPETDPNITVPLYTVPPVHFLLYIGGAGGKGVWGPAGVVYDEDEVDFKDPNYDAEQVRNTCYIGLPF